MPQKNTVEYLIVDSSQLSQLNAETGIYRKLKIIFMRTHKALHTKLRRQNGMTVYGKKLKCPH